MSERASLHFEINAFEAFGKLEKYMQLKEICVCASCTEFGLCFNALKHRLMGVFVSSLQ